MHADWFALDAEVIGVISSKAFRARLRNGHEFVAFFACAADVRPLVVGDQVTVEMSPCDMGKGRIRPMNEVVRR